MLRVADSNAPFALFGGAEFPQDAAKRTITMYPRPNSGNRLPEYAEHMQQKFPDHEVVWWR